VINPPTGDLSTLSIMFEAEILINAVVTIFGYQKSNSYWPEYQTNVAIYSNTIGGPQQLCGVLSNYYPLYVETSCQRQANSITLKQQTSTHDLRLCGVGALADCDCSLSSFNPAL
jgi:hypothetical protein